MDKENPLPKTAASKTLQQSLPGSYYHSKEIFAQEKEKILCREWFCAAREEQLGRPGDYLVLEIAGESILVVRSKEGQARESMNLATTRRWRI